MEDSIKIVEPLNKRDLTRDPAEGGGPAKRVIIHNGTFETIISLENLFTAWQEFRQGKRKKQDVQKFARHLEDNIFSLHEDLTNGTYECSDYYQFRITDPKPRQISKASVRDRLLHHALYRILYPIFDQTFIFDSYSCRKNKGTHKAFKRLAEIVRKVSDNYTRPCYALKCDIKKFFDNIDHSLLFALLEQRIVDKRVLNLLRIIIESFHVTPCKGLPLGNLTSQLLVNIYLDPLDKLVRHDLKAKYYLRYADDFIILSPDPSELVGYFVEINQFLKNRLKLFIHPNKIYLRRLEWGIDFVGYVALPHYNLPRKRTVKRILRKINDLALKDSEQLKLALPSYLGYLQHVNAYKLSCKIKKSI